MTEEQARTKWCPHARVMGFNNEGPGNSWLGENGKPSGSQCIASHCMAWRWHDNPDALEDEPFEGFCGLAGRP